MVDLKRMTIWGIESLIANHEELTELGEGTIKGDRRSEHDVLLKIAEEREVIEAPFSIEGSTRKEFFEYINGLLEEKKMYLADFDYREEMGAGYFPHRLKGIFYKEK